MVKEYLSQQGVTYLEKNISEDAAARTELVSMGYRSAPVTVIGEHRIVGYKPQALEQALQATKSERA